MEAVEVEVIDIKTELQVFDPVAKAITEAKEKNASLVFDYEDKQGNKEARSWIAQLRKLKAPLNEVHKLQKAQAKKLCDALDTEKRKYMGVIEEMINVHHEPIWEIEQRELAVEAEKMAEENAKKEAEEEKARLELEAREQAVRDERTALDAEKAKLAQAERERQIAETYALKAQEDAKQAAIDAENKRIADVQREKDKAAAEAAEKEAELAQQKRYEASCLREKEAAEQLRQADVEHRKTIHLEIYNALINKVLPPEAKVICVALRDGKIPHVTITY